VKKAEKGKNVSTQATTKDCAVAKYMSVKITEFNSSLEEKEKSAEKRESTHHDNRTAAPPRSLDG
jgi:hypothetical protein